MKREGDDTGDGLGVVIMRLAVATVLAVGGPCWAVELGGGGYYWAAWAVIFATVGGLAGIYPSDDGVDES